MRQPESSDLVLMLERVKAACPTKHDVFHLFYDADRPQESQDYRLLERLRSLGLVYLHAEEEGHRLYRPGRE